MQQVVKAVDEQGQQGSKEHVQWSHKDSIRYSQVINCECVTATEGEGEGELISVVNVKL